MKEKKRKKKFTLCQLTLMKDFNAFPFIFLFRCLANGSRAEYLVPAAAALAQLAVRGHHSLGGLGLSHEP